MVVEYCIKEDKKNSNFYSLHLIHFHKEGIDTERMFGPFGDIWYTERMVETTQQNKMYTVYN